MFLLEPLHVLSVLPDHPSAVLATPASFLRQLQVVRLQAAASALDLAHLRPHAVQVTLEAVLHLTGEAGAVGADLLQVVSLLLAGELEGDVLGEEAVDLAQESPGDVGDTAQGTGEVFLTLPGV